MKKNKKSILVLMAMMLMFAMILAACSEDDATKPTKTDDNATEMGKPKTDVKKEPVELTVWSKNVGNGMPDSSDPKKTEIFNYVQTKMEEKFPGIKITYVDKGWADSLRQSLMLSVMGGNPPDVSDGEDFIPEFARIGALSEVPNDIAAGLAEGPMTAARYDGKTYAVSGMTGVFSLVYNKDVMVKAGLDPNSPPKTWDEWLDMSKKITEAGKGEYYGSLVQNMGLGGAFRIAPFMRQLGGDFTNADWSAPTFNSPANTKALTFLRELSKTAPPGSTSLGDEGAFYNMLHHGKVAFGVGGPWHITWGADEGCNCGFAPLPLPDDGKRANVVVGNVLFFVLKQSEHQEEGMEFLRIMASEEYQEKLAIMSSRLPSNLEASKSEALNNAVPDLKVFEDIVANESGGPLPVYPKNGPKVWEAWYKAQDIALVSDKSIDDALSNAQTEAEAQYK